MNDNYDGPSAQDVAKLLRELAEVLEDQTR
jgi:hypothetical protein